MAQTIKPPKQPGEKVWYSINFGVKNALAVGDALASLSSVTCRRIVDNVDVTASLVVPNSGGIVGNKATFLAQGGTDGVDYRYTVVVTTTLGETLEEDLLLPVRES